MKSPIFWDITPCSPLKVNRRFGGICVQGRRISQARNHQEAGSKQGQRLILRPWRWCQHVPPKRRLIFNGLHGVISRKLGLLRKQCIRLGHSILTQRLTIADAHFRRNSVNADALVAAGTRVDLARNASRRGSLRTRIIISSPKSIESLHSFINFPLADTVVAVPDYDSCLRFTGSRALWLQKSDRKSVFVFDASLKKKKLNSVALVRKRTIPTERPPLSAK
jgi:hypothetical protein